MRRQGRRVQRVHADECGGRRRVMFYWIASNVFSFLQTFVLYKFYTPERMRAIAEKESQKRKKNPSRYQQAMRDARRAQALKEGLAALRPYWRTV